MQRLDKNYFWVVIRHEVDYINQAVLGNMITIFTWVGESRGVKSVRHVQIQKGEVDGPYCPEVTDHRYYP